MRTALFVLCTLLLVGALPQLAHAADITVVRGELLTIVGDTGVRGEVDKASATFSMPEIGYFRDLSVSDVRDPVFRDSVRIRAEPGIYALTIRLGVNGETVDFRSLTVEVIAARPTTPTPSVPREPVVSVTAPSRVVERITVQPIPDLTPGEQFVLPLKITGKGMYVIEIPSLPFGTYEIPNPVYVDGERVVPVLIRVDRDADPGTYVIPIYMAGEQYPVRVRIISYTTRPNNLWAFVLAGSILILIAIILLLLIANRGKGPRNENRRNTETQPRATGSDPEPLITYY